jgi:hypothetical protein
MSRLPVSALDATRLGNGHPHRGARLTSALLSRMASTYNTPFHLWVAETLHTSRHLLILVE